MSIYTQVCSGCTLTALEAPTTGTKDLGMRGGGGTVMSAGRPIGREDDPDDDGCEENSDSEAVLACGSELLDQTLTGGGGTAATEAALEAGEEAPGEGCSNR